MEETIEEVENTEEDIPTSELYRRVSLPIQANMQREMHANQVALKGLYVDWLFDQLNLSHKR